MREIKAPIGKMEKQLKQWGAKLDDMVAEAEDASAEARRDYRKRIDHLKSKHQAAKLKLDELRAAGGDKWETLKAGIESAWEELEGAFEKLTR
jgi:hypothetical protein